MSQEIVRAAPLKSQQKLPSSKPSDTKEPKVRSYREDRDITCYLLIADVLIVCGDFKNADRYFKKAADLGNLYAQHELSYEDTELHNYPKTLPMTPVFFANHCIKSMKTPSPRMCWMLARLYERLPCPDLSKAEEYYKKASAGKYLRAYIALNQSDKFSELKSHEKVIEHYNEIIKIDNAHILFLSGSFFDTQFKALISSTMGPMFNAEFATQFVKPQYKELFYEMAAKRGYPRAHFELGKYHKNKFEKDLSKRYIHLKEAQTGFERILEILRSDKEILQNPGFFNENGELFFQKNKEYVELELNALQKLIIRQPLAVPQTSATSIVSDQPPKTTNAKKRKKLKRKKAGKKSVANVNASSVASAPASTVTPSVAPLGTTDDESKNATSKSSELGKLPLVDASEQPEKHQNNTADVTTTSVAPAEKKSTSTAKKERSSTAKKALVAPASTSAEKKASPAVSATAATTFKLQKAEHGVQKNNKVAPKAGLKIKDAIASDLPAAVSQNLHPKKAVPPTVENKPTVSKANPKPGSVAVNNASTTANQNLNQRPKISANTSRKPAINTASTSASVTSVAPISNRVTNYSVTSTSNNPQSTAAPTTVQKTITTASPAKTSLVPKQEGKKSYADLLKTLTAPTASPTVRSSVNETKENNINAPGAAQPTPVVPASVAVPAPLNNEFDKNLVAAPDLTAVNSEETVVTTPTPDQQQPAVVVPPQASFAHPTFANLAVDYQYGQIPQAPMPSVPVAIPTPATVDPIALALSAVFQAGRNSMAHDAFIAAQYYQYCQYYQNHQMAAWGALPYSTQPWFPLHFQVPTQTSVQHPDPRWSSSLHHAAVNMPPPAYGSHGSPMVPPPPEYGANSNVFLYHGAHPNPLHPGENLAPSPDVTQNENTFG